MSTRYYYLDPDGETVKGPYTAPEVRGEWTRRGLPDTTKCIREGEENWQNFRAFVDEFYSLQPKPALSAAPSHANHAPAGMPVIAWIVGGGLSLVLVCLLLASHPGGTASMGSDPAFEAYDTATEVWIRPKLKNPAGAKFSAYSESTVSRDGDLYEVSGWVDATNDFNAVRRRYFHAQLRPDPDGQHWNKVDLKFD